MTYGWAALALLAALGVLGYFTGVHTKIIPSKCELEMPYICKEYKVTEDGIVQLGIVNSVHATDYLNVSLFCDDETEPLTYINMDYQDARQRLNGTLLRFGCPQQSGIFRGTLTLTYSSIDEQVLHQSTGILRLHVE